MSIYAIQTYYSQLENIIQYGGSKKETAIRNAFYSLLNEYAKPKNLLLVTEISLKTKKGTTVIPDGTLKDALRLNWGYWEAKDTNDVLAIEIQKKFENGYPQDNILFEDSETAYLIQEGIEVMKINMKDAQALDKLLRAFVNYEKVEIQEFREAIEHFKKDIPVVTEVLREKIMIQEKENATFKQARNDFWELCKASINPEISKEDIREMMIQHILTEDIFISIFDETQFHRENNMAQALEKVVYTFFVKEVKRETMAKIQHYYLTIKAAAANITDHHEKQKFLKIVYENFYKAYNPKGADRLGIVYTPNEIVRFMVKSTDYLLYKHFDKYLEDKGVEILDPATGTGTYITDIIDFIRKEKLEYKYKNEIHANEVAILPYYIANLNIEYTYKQKMGKYIEFENLCFMDTLDNMDFGFKGKQTDIFSITHENAARIKRQNDRKISVIIGNPPYNANQQNENDNNKNREYKGIDKRIKDTFIRESTAQKTKVYDMYARFFRWAMDRIHENGVIAFITNRSFIESRTFDGFRKCIQQDFSSAYIIDTKSDVRANPNIAGTTHNVFGIQTGVAILFLIKQPKESDQKCNIRYISLEEEWRKEEKLQWFAENSIDKLPFERIRPDKNNNWINLAEENDWETFLPVCSKDKINKTVFQFYSNGINTARDEWVYDFDKDNLAKKITYFVDTYNSLLAKKDVSWNQNIKWSEQLKSSFQKGKKILFNDSLLIKGYYRPFTKLWFYSESLLSDRLTQNHYDIFGSQLQKENICICFSGIASSKPFQTLVIQQVTSFDFLEKTQCLPYYRYDKEGNPKENISDWALAEFRARYSPPTPPEGGSIVNVPPPIPPKGGSIVNVPPSTLVEEETLCLLPPFGGVGGDSLPEGEEQQNDMFDLQTPISPPIPLKGGDLPPLPPFGGVGGDSLPEGENQQNDMFDLQPPISPPTPPEEGSIVNVPPPIPPKGGDLPTLPPFGGVGGDSLPEGEDTENKSSFKEVNLIEEPTEDYQDKLRRSYSTLSYMKEMRKELRKNATSAERYLWLALQNRQLLGRKFRRQHSFANYVVDFYCHEEKLVIELDGAFHFTNVGEQYDTERTNFLSSLGLKVIRFENQVLINDIEGVLREISSHFTIQKRDIFHYVYAVLHHPAYKQKYELNLKRDFPRIPFYEDFWKWATWGQQLMELHLHYEEVSPYPLTEKHIEKEKPKAKLKVNKENGEIIIDESTSLLGVPALAYEYKLGNRSALEWVLDQYKESKPSDATIATHFHTYQFAVYKKEVIALLKKICTVAMETMRIVREMEKENN